VAASISSAVKRPGFDWRNPEHLREYNRRYGALWRKARRGKALEGFKPRDKQLNADRACTLKEVADAMGISVERVRQLERSALRKMRAAYERSGIEFNMLVPPEEKPNFWQVLMSYGEDGEACEF
jgi:DNA-binding CsgD family transcriptional regulator